MKNSRSYLLFYRQQLQGGGQEMFGVVAID